VAYLVKEGVQNQLPAGKTISIATQIRNDPFP